MAGESHPLLKAAVHRTCLPSRCSTYLGQFNIMTLDIWDNLKYPSKYLEQPSFIVLSI